MDTITNAVSTASKAIFGEQSPPAQAPAGTTATVTPTMPGAAAGNETRGEEPVSGLQGKGTVAEPFDQGNAPNPTTPAGKADVATTAHSPTPSLSPSPSPSHSHPPAPATSTAPMSAPAPTAAEVPHNPNNASVPGGPNPLENTAGTGVTGASAQKYTPSAGDALPSSRSDNPGVAPASGAAPAQKQQGADRPEAAPAAASSTDEPDMDAILKKRDPNDHSGEPMHMHTGPEKVPDTQAERRESKVGNPGGQQHGAEPKGTGEEWVKTSGLHADGGDFDATKPGAGREADRILEEKGIHRDAATGAMDNPEAAGTGEAGKEKGSKMAKLKEKLHIGGSKDN